jgi:hypothetical protein
MIPLGFASALIAATLAAGSAAPIIGGVIQIPPVDYLSVEVRHPDGVEPNAQITERFRVHIGMFRCQAWKDARTEDERDDALEACWAAFMPHA